MEIEQQDELIKQNQQILTESLAVFKQSKQKLITLQEEYKGLEIAQKRNEITHKNKVDMLEKEQETLYDENQKMTIEMSNRQHDLRDHTEVLEKITMKVNHM